MNKILAHIFEEAIISGGNIEECVDKAMAHFLRGEYFDSLDTLHKAKVCKAFLEAELSDENDGTIDYWEAKLSEVNKKIDKVAKQVALLEAQKRAAEGSES